MAGAVRLLFLAVIFLLPGGSLVLAALAARSAVRNRAWTKGGRPVTPPSGKPLRA